MKTLLLAATTLVAAVFCSCQQSPTSATSERPILPSTPGGGSTPAHPALTYVASVTSHGTSYETVAVMDTDGTHQANVYSASSSSTAISRVCWSPTGGSVAWVENAHTIKACDVSVNSSGVPVGSNVRTIYTTTEQINGMAWSSTSTTAKIAFTALHSTGGGHGVSEVYTVSQSGGTATTLVSLTDTTFRSPTWNSDDSKLAVLKGRGISHNYHLWVLDASTGSLLENDDLTSLYTVDGLEWARTGNTIAFNDQDTNSSPHSHIYYLDYSSGTGAYTQHTLGSYPTWSPNDAGLMIDKPNSSGVTTVYKMPAFGTSTTSIATVGLTGVVKWRR